MSMALFTLIIISAAIIALSILFFHKIWNPILLCVSMFLLGILLAKGDCKSNDFEAAVYWILIGETLLSVSFFATQALFRRRTIIKNEIAEAYNTQKIINILRINLIISVASLAVGIYTVMQVAPSFIDIFVNSTYVRYLYLARSDGAIVTIFSLILSLNFFVTFAFFPIAIQNKMKGSLKLLCVVLAIRLFGSLVTMSKQAFLIDVIYFISVYVMLLENKKSEYNFYKKYGTLFVALIVVLLIVVSFQRNYIGQGRYESYFDAVAGTLRSYMAVSIEAFGGLLNLQGLNLTYGNLCFRPVVNVLSYFGIGEHATVIQDALTNVTNSNVYSCFGNMYRDFSYSGIIGLSIFFGMFMGIIYNANHRYRISRLVSNGIITMTMFFAYYDLMIIQTVYLFIMIYGWFFDRYFGKWIYRSREQ